jgi:hypothetical protein
MQRKFNYTNRVKLLQADVRFTLATESETATFDAVLDLDSYDLPPDALVFVEAYRQTAWMRFEWGTVAKLQVPTDRRLTEFESPEDILFRVRVTSPGSDDDDHGLLVAEADRIRLRGPEETEDTREPLLPVIPDDLGDELWRLDLAGEKPRLLLNRNAGGDYRQIGRHPAFVALVYPAAMRVILWHILQTEDHHDFDDPDNPHSRWLRFAVDVLGVGEPPDEEADVERVTDWIDAAVAAFAAKHKLLDEFKAFWSKEEEG